MSATEPHPEVTADESGIVPPQGNRPPDWPKKIRTLTATELDRLTIDSAGRFYWDGRLVNYEPPRVESGQGRTDSTARRWRPSPRDYRHDDHKTPEPIEGADLDRPDDARARPSRIATNTCTISTMCVRPAHFVHHSAMGGDFRPSSPPVVHIPDRVRISMTRWQSFGAIIVVLCAAARFRSASRRSALPPRTSGAAAPG